MLALCKIITLISAVVLVVASFVSCFKSGGGRVPDNYTLHTVYYHTRQLFIINDLVSYVFH